MTAVSDISSAGIQLKSYSVGDHNTTCPRCSHTRKAGNQKKPCLSVTIQSNGSAVWFCHNCGWSGAGGKVHKQKQDEVIDPKKKVYQKPAPKEGQYTKTLPKEVKEFLEKRAIPMDVVEKNGLMYEPWSKSLCFPYWDMQNGKLEMVNIKHRSIVEKHMMRFVKEAKLPFYGMDTHFQEAWKQSETIIIVEGEYDKLALNACGFWNVLSVPHGAPAHELKQDTKKLDFLIHADVLLKKTKKFILALDNDVPGQNLFKELLRRFGPERCYSVEWPQGNPQEPIKDSNDVLKVLGSDVLCDIINEAVPYPINGLFSVNDFEKSLEDFYNQEMQSGAKTGWENIDQFYTVMPGRLTVVTGIPYAGKSEWLDALTINLAKFQNHKFAIFSPEHSKEEHVTKLVEKITEKPAAHDSEDRMTREEFLEGAKWVNSRYFFIVSDDMNELPTIDWIFTKAKVAIMRHGINGLVIDPYNELEHQRPAHMQETDYISKLLAKIKRFAKMHQIHIWIVAHPTKQQKDKDGNIQVPGGYDISGSANWLNKTDNLISIHRPSESHVTEVHIKKVKPKYAGRQGVCNLIYNRGTGIYSVSESQTEYEPIGKKKSKVTEERFFDSQDGIETF